MIDLLLYITIAFAIARLTLLLSRDDLFQKLRHCIFIVSPPENNERLGWYYQNYTKSTKNERELAVAVIKGETMMGLPTIGTNWLERRYIATDSEQRSPGFVGSIISCPDCLGVWVAGGWLGLYLLIPDVIVMASMVFAASMVTSLIARRY